MDANVKEDYLLMEDQHSEMVKSDLSEIDSASPEQNSNDINCRDQLLEDALLTSDSDNCGICGDDMVMPRILHCLHVFCGGCLEKMIMNEAGDAGSSNTSIACPTCNFETKVGLKKIAALPMDVTKANVSDVSNSSNLTCTSCTAKEVAKSSCNTCHNLLCGNCDTAHHYMRCFESHKVVALDDMKKDGIKITVHKPLECEAHQGDNVIYNCVPCNALICAQCVKGDHKDHLYESVIDSEVRVREDIENLLINSKDKIEILSKNLNNINNNMEELAHQRTAAKDLINETYQSYKVILEKCKNESLDELNKLYHDRELKIMKESDQIGKAIGNLEDACKYSNKLLETGTALEMLYLRNVVVSRLLTLNINLPKTDKGFNVEFKTDLNNFEKATKEHFGKFVTETDTHFSPSINTNIDNIPALDMNGVLSKTPSLTNGCHLSLPTPSIPPNLDVAAAAAAAAAATNLQGYSSMAEFNIAQLATLAETTSSPNTSPTSQFNLADLLTNDTAYKNLASLAKLGLNTSDNTPTIVANGANMLVRSTSSASINLTNNLMNGFGAVSNSTSPLLTTSEDILQADTPLPNLIPSPSNTSAPNRTNKVSPMQIRCKFGQLGPSKGQFNSPHGFCLGLEEDIIVADTNNHRIQVFDKTGSFKLQFGIPGKEEGQLWYPRKVAVMRNTGKYVVCDRGNERSRMQIFTKNGHFIRKIAIRYIDIVAGLAVTAIGEIVAVDSVSPTVFIIHENGELLRWFDCSDYMREPSDIAIHGKEYYVCDFKGHNVVVFSDEGQFLRRIGCETLTNFPNGIDISDAGDILIGDSHGNRFHVAVFARDGSLISEFECPYVKVSRCCGLKITSEGYVVTLAKNNHHVLVLNTLYIL